MKIRLSAFSDEAAESLEGQIAALQRNNIKLTELRCIDGVNVKDFTPDYAKEVKKKLDGGGISVWSVGSPLGKVKIDVDFEEYLETVKRVMETANILGTDKVRVFSFFNAYNERGRVLENLNKMVETAAYFGVKLYHENEKDIYGDTAERVLDIYENVKGMNFVYDPANFLQVGESAENTLKLLHAKTDYFHIKDVISSTGELVPAGYGDGNIKKLLDMLEKDVTLSVEPHLSVFKGYSQIDATAMKHRYVYGSNAEAFDAAVNALKALLKDKNYN